jgi:hypothetical protein
MSRGAKFHFLLASNPVRMNAPWAKIQIGGQS